MRMKLSRPVFTRPSLNEKYKLIIKKLSIIFGLARMTILISWTARTSDQCYTYLIISNEIICASRGNELFKVPTAYNKMLLFLYLLANYYLPRIYFVSDFTITDNNPETHVPPTTTHLTDYNAESKID